MSRPGETVSDSHGAGSPQERQRVRRACEACRKRKIKCDGDEPCKRCNAQNLTCVYSEWNTASDGNSSAIKTLEMRLLEMEKNFSTFRNDIVSSITALNASTSAAKEAPFPSSEAIRNDERNARERSQSHQLGPVLSPPSEDECMAADEAAARDLSWELTDSDDGPHQQQHASKPECEYTDGFGELDPDLCGHLRFVGLSSTATIVDRCPGLRQHINQGLQLKGHQQGEAFLTTPNSEPADRVPLWIHHRVRQSLPSPSVMQKLMDAYFHNLSSLFPIVTMEETNTIYGRFLAKQTVDIGHAAVLLSMIASASLLMDKSCMQLDTMTACQDGAAPGALYYDLATEITTLIPQIAGATDLEANVVTKALLSLYLVAIGSQAEAWILIGDAIRRGQDLGLHRSPEMLKLPVQRRDKRLRIWWCLYILEVQLSTALGRPLAILDEDCSVELPSENTEIPYMADFLSTIRLHQILKGILRTINSIKNPTNWHDDAKRNNLKSMVYDHHCCLVEWAERNAPDQLQSGTSETHTATRSITLSFFYTSVLLLYRLFMPHPHRPSTPETEKAQNICAKNAIQCIRVSEGFLQHVPVHYLIFHIQNIFVGVIVLLQCIRSSNDRTFTATAFSEVRKATNSLKSTESKIVEARKYLAIIEEYIDITRLMQQGVYRKGICNFSHSPEHHRSSGTSHNHPEKHRLGGNSFGLQTTQLSQTSSKRRNLPPHKQNSEKRPRRFVSPPAQPSLNLPPTITSDFPSSAQTSGPRFSQKPPTGMLERATTESASVCGQSLAPEMGMPFGASQEASTSLFMDLPSLDAMDSDLFWFDANCGSDSFVGELDSRVFDLLQGSVFPEGSSDRRGVRELDSGVH